MTFLARLLGADAENWCLVLPVFTDAFLTPDPYFCMRVCACLASDVLACQGGWRGKVERGAEGGGEEGRNGWGLFNVIIEQPCSPPPQQSQSRSITVQQTLHPTGAF